MGNQESGAVLNTKAASHDRKHYQYGQMMGPSRNRDKELCTFKKKQETSKDKSEVQGTDFNLT